MSEDTCDGCVHKSNDGKEYYDDACFDTGKRKAPAMIARAALRSERTLTERVAVLERDMVAVKREQEAVKRRVAALEQAKNSK